MATRNKISAEKKTIPIGGNEWNRLRNRKAGAVEHRLDRRLKTRNNQNMHAMSEQCVDDDPDPERFWYSIEAAS